MEFLRKIRNVMLREGVLFGTGLLCVLLWRRRYYPDYMGTFAAAIATFEFFNLMLYIFKRRDGKGTPCSYPAEHEENLNEQLEMKPESEENLPSGRISNGVKVDVNKENGQAGGAVGNSEMQEMKAVGDGGAVGNGEMQEKKAVGDGGAVGNGEMQEKKAVGAGGAVDNSEMQEKKAVGAGGAVGSSEMQKKKARGADPTTRRIKKDEVVTPATDQDQPTDSDLEHSEDFAVTLGLDDSEAKKIKDILIGEFKRLHETGRYYETSCGKTGGSKCVELSEVESSVYQASQHFKKFDFPSETTDPTGVKAK